MIVGVPAEVKVHEYRVGLVPAGVRTLVARGHRVLIEAGAGLGSGIPDEEYVRAGGEIAPSPADVFAAADMVVKVKEPQPQEYGLLRDGQVLFTYLHLAPAPELTAALLDRGIVGIAYETVELPDGSLPLLTPMSEVAGRLSIQAGAHCLEKEAGGRGQLLGGVPGAHRGKVVVLGGGVVGANAAKMAVGLGAHVVILDIDMERLRYLDDVFDGRLTLLHSSEHALAEELSDADLVVGAVLVTGHRAPQLITREMVAAMPTGSVLVDVAVDQGGCAETTRPTTHADPTYVVDGVVHYCVANMPGAVARTSTFALTGATLGYVLALADLGCEGALRADPALAKGLNVMRGKVTCEAVAEELGYEFTPVEQLLG